MIYMDEVFELPAGMSIENIERDNGFTQRLSEMEEMIKGNSPDNTDTHLARGGLTAYTKSYDARTAV